MRGRLRADTRQTRAEIVSKHDTLDMDMDAIKRAERMVLVEAARARYFDRVRLKQAQAQGPGQGQVAT